MKWLKYTYRTIVNDGVDENGNAIEREVFTEMAVPDTDTGRALAEKEAYNGEITEYDDGQEESASPTLESRVNTLEADSAEMAEALDMILNEVTE